MDSKVAFSLLSLDVFNKVLNAIPKKTIHPTWLLDTNLSPQSLGLYISSVRTYLQNRQYIFFKI